MIVRLEFINYGESDDPGPVEEYESVQITFTRIRDGDGNVIAEYDQEDGYGWWHEGTRRYWSDIVISVAS